MTQLWPIMTFSGGGLAPLIPSLLTMRLCSSSSSSSSLSSSSSYMSWSYSARHPQYAIIEPLGDSHRAFRKYKEPFSYIIYAHYNNRQLHHYYNDNGQEGKRDKTWQAWQTPSNKSETSFKKIGSSGTSPIQRLRPSWFFWSFLRRIRFCFEHSLNWSINGNNKGKIHKGKNVAWEVG